MEPRIPTKIRILAFLEKKGPARGTQIARELEASVTAVYTALRELRAAGLIEYNASTKTYAITDAGRAELARLRAELAAAPSTA